MIKIKTYLKQTFPNSIKSEMWTWRLLLLSELEDNIALQIRIFFPNDDVKWKKKHSKNFNTFMQGLLQTVITFKVQLFSLNKTVLACLEISELYMLFWTPDSWLSINLGNKIQGTQQGNFFSRALLS